MDLAHGSNNIPNNSSAVEIPNSRLGPVNPCFYPFVSQAGRDAGIGLDSFFLSESLLVPGALVSFSLEYVGEVPLVLDLSIIVRNEYGAPESEYRLNAPPDIQLRSSLGAVLAETRKNENVGTLLENIYCTLNARNRTLPVGSVAFRLEGSLVRSPTEYMMIPSSTEAVILPIVRPFSEVARDPVPAVMRYDVHVASHHLPNMYGMSVDSQRGTITFSGAVPPTEWWIPHVPLSVSVPLYRSVSSGATGASPLGDFLSSNAVTQESFPTDLVTADKSIALYVDELASVGFLSFISRYSPTNSGLAFFTEEIPREADVSQTRTRKSELFSYSPAGVVDLAISEGRAHDVAQHITTLESGSLLSIAEGESYVALTIRAPARLDELGKPTIEETYPAALSWVFAKEPLDPKVPSPEAVVWNAYYTLGRTDPFKSLDKSQEVIQQLNALQSIHRSKSESAVDAVSVAPESVFAILPEDTALQLLDLPNIIVDTVAPGRASFPSAFELLGGCQRLTITLPSPITTDTLRPDATSYEQLEGEAVLRADDFDACTFGICKDGLNIELTNSLGGKLSAYLPAAVGYRVNSVEEDLLSIAKRFSGQTLTHRLSFQLFLEQFLAERSSSRLASFGALPYVSSTSVLEPIALRQESTPVNGASYRYLNLTMSAPKVVESPTTWHNIDYTLLGKIAVDSAPYLTNSYFERSVSRKTLNSYEGDALVYTLKGANSTSLSLYIKQQRVIGLSAEVRPFHKGYQHFTVTAKAPISITDTHDPLALSKEFMEAFSLLSEEFSRNFYEVGAIGAKALLSATSLGSLLEARLGSQHVNYRESHDNFS